MSLPDLTSSPTQNKSDPYLYKSFEKLKKLIEHYKNNGKDQAELILTCAFRVLDEKCMIDPQPLLDYFGIDGEFTPIEIDKHPADKLKDLFKDAGLMEDYCEYKAWLGFANFHDRVSVFIGEETRKNRATVSNIINDAIRYQIYIEKYNQYADSRQTLSKTPIIDACVSRVVINQSDSIPIYDITFTRKYDQIIRDHPPRKEHINVKGDINYICQYLKNTDIVFKERHLKDVLASLISGLRKQGLAIIDNRPTVYGIFDVDGEIITNLPDMYPPTKENIREALSLINELREKWYKHLGEKFTTILKWGLISALCYIRKQRIGDYYPFLILTDASTTGKTTIGKIILKIWGSEYIHRGTSLNTEPRLGRHLKSTTLPILVNEAKSLFKNESGRTPPLEMLKTCVEDLIARGKYTDGSESSYREFPAYASLLLTMNGIPSIPGYDIDALFTNRYFVIPFSIRDKFTEKRRKEFDDRFINKGRKLGKLDILSCIGAFISNTIKENPAILE